ncbi:hypothetical protein BY996DRAFT_6547382 [Phakopsora pachyrhizi]|nr:hypothetical protein BY996DRAFT_6547382 [Phakopsora pachyrhizi]
MYNLKDFCVEVLEADNDFYSKVVEPIHFMDLEDFCKEVLKLAAKGDVYFVGRASGLRSVGCPGVFTSLGPQRDS